ncbi:MAG: hypothetical protein GSR81_02855 [Desulfurococcales archaeon]|nr:hypothetical protein [Desulfurococcales archaeon]
MRTKYLAPALATLILFLGQTNTTDTYATAPAPTVDIGTSMAALTSIIVAIIPLFVLIAVIKMLFRTFEKVNYTRTNNIAMKLLNAAALIMMLGQTDSNVDMGSAIASISYIITAVLPILVLVLVLKMLFRTFEKVNYAKIKAKLASGLATMLLLLGQTNTTNPWSTNLDVWNTITSVVVITLPFLVLIVVLRSIFRAFSKEW